MQGCFVRVFAVDQDPNSKARLETRDSVQYHIIPSLRGQRFFTSQHHPLLALQRAAVDYSPADVVHMFQPFLTTYAPWCRALSTKTGSHWFDWDDLWTDGGLMGDHFRGGVRNWWAYYWANRIENKAPRVATGVTAVSTWLTEEAMRRGARKTLRIHNGLWPRIPMPKTAARNKFNLSTSAIYLGFMGRTVSSTEFSWCLDCLKAVIPYYEVRLAICGPLDHLVELIQPVLRQNIDYLGVLSPTDCFDFAAALDFALLPLEDSLFNKSRFPIKLCDYLSAQTKVIVSTVGDCAGFGNIGALIQAGKGREEWISTVVAAVEHSIQGILQPVDREEIETKFSWERIGAKVLAGYASN